MSQPKPYNGARQKPQAETLNQNPPRQSGTSVGRSSDARALQKAMRGDRFHTLQDPAGYGESEYKEVTPVDIGEGTYSYSELANRHDAREAAHNALVRARNSHHFDGSSPDAKGQSGADAPLVTRAQISRPKTGTPWTPPAGKKRGI